METNNRIALNELKKNQNAYLYSINDESIKRLMEQLGLFSGTKIVCELKSGKDDIAAYRIKGALIGIRAEDAIKIIVST